MRNGSVARAQRRTGSLLSLAAILAAALLISACASSQAGQDEAKRASVEDAWGIRVLRVVLTGGGGLVDLRYQVTDADKAAAALGGSAHTHGRVRLEDIKSSVQLVDEASGIALLEAQIHFMGRVQTQRLAPKEGLTRFILFSNTEGLIERGSNVSLAIADLNVEHLVVQ